MNSANIAQIARRQLEDYDAHQPGLVFADGPFQLTVDEAYAVQMHVAALRAARGEAIAGYKIGCLSEPVQRQLNLDRPVFGHVFASELYGSGVSLDPANFECLAIEGEFAVRIAEDVAGSTPLPETPERWIASVFPVIELHNFVFRRAIRTAQELVANNALHAGVILPSIDDEERNGAELSPGVISVFRNGELLGTAAGESLVRGLLASVLQIAGHVGSFGGVLRRGQILLTGSPLPLYPVGTGDHITVCCGSTEVTAYLRQR